MQELPKSTPEELSYKYLEYTASARSSCNARTCNYKIMQGQGPLKGSWRNLITRMCTRPWSRTFISGIAAPHREFGSSLCQGRVSKFAPQRNESDLIAQTDERVARAHVEFQKILLAPRKMLKNLVGVKRFFH